uniref:Uncharacterized protein n=1 Tax=Ixodes ricinus TaxID=34613 RepID=A0A6B0V4L1_IXORI
MASVSFQAGPLGCCSSSAGATLPLGSSSAAFSGERRSSAGLPSRSVSDESSRLGASSGASPPALRCRSVRRVTRPSSGGERARRPLRSWRCAWPPESLSSPSEPSRSEASWSDVASLAVRTACLRTPRPLRRAMAAPRSSSDALLSLLLLLLSLSLLPLVLPLLPLPLVLLPLVLLLLLLRFARPSTSWSVPSRLKIRTSSESGKYDGKAYASETMKGAGISTSVQR